MPQTEAPTVRKLVRTGTFFFLAWMLGFSLPAMAGDAPSWMKSLVNAPVPAHDEKTDAVLMYSETVVNVIAIDKIKTTVREAYKILRPGGRNRGVVQVNLSSTTKVNGLHGWSIPAQGKDYEVKDKDSVEVAHNIDGGELLDDAKVRLLRIPASEPGNIVGYEYEVEEVPLVLQEIWAFQNVDPVRESHFTLQLPSGWEYKTAWLNYAEAKPNSVGRSAWEWVVNDVKALRREEAMPPYQGMMGLMVVSFVPPGLKSAGFSNWREMGEWYFRLLLGRADASPEIKKRVAELTASAKTQTEKMQAIARFVQQDIRYVAIELGIGGWQPHLAADVFKHRYGDCKDKVTLMRSMLAEVGVESYDVVINTQRGSITPETPAYQGFNHAILAIKLPDGAVDPSMLATMQHPKLGKILFFDPTDELTPLGQIGGYLQSNYGLLVAPVGGELLELPKLQASTNSVQRIAKLTLEPGGVLKGDVEEKRVGDRAQRQRYSLRSVTKDSERVKPIESLLAGSFSNFQITRASALNIQQPELPLGFNYSIVVNGYAQNAGGLLLVRPRVLGSKSSGILETKEPRKFPIEFEGPVRDEDSFEITLPPGYEVDDLPPPVDAEFSFASYHSKTQAKGNVITYTRTFEVKELSVPVTKAEELKKFYRIIASDERNTAVLKPAR
jgi:predicted transglutaminase-like cysteine proteinase